MGLSMSRMAREGVVAAASPAEQVFHQRRLSSFKRLQRATERQFGRQSNVSNRPRNDDSIISSICGAGGVLASGVGLLQEHDVAEG